VTADVSEKQENAVKFEKYMLSHEDCEYMREQMKYMQGGDVFYIPLCRNIYNMDIHYNGIEFPPGYDDLAYYLFLYRVEQYKTVPADRSRPKKERLFIAIPRRPPPYKPQTGYVPIYEVRFPPRAGPRALQIEWLDEAE